MFRKVLIANRGAIACRITRTLRAMGVASVAVYADSDADSLHVCAADEAYPLGDGAAGETYLNIDKLLSIAKDAGVDAVHPGYGFLSENAEFVRRCEQASIVFVGPAAEHMEAFGLKHRARQLAQQAGVPLSPGSELLPDLESARRAAADIGYPVMLKSTAGGGGIGMQLCHRSEELADAWDAVRRLGANNFADDSVYLEKYIGRARHIEVQVFGDGRGGALALGERDCSAQRRNQKVIEECPAPGLSEAERSELCATAERLLGSVQYRNAGTVEFIYDADDGAFYFLEVNTRLQVEHGVTEAVYGVDLVQWMLEQAAGELAPLYRLREGLQPSGHAVQSRVYAEDPYLDFRPCSGLLVYVSFPTEQHLRVDHWIESGVEVSPLFDPMLAKVIVHGGSRAEALRALAKSLDATELYGIETNLDYLRHLLRDSVLMEGQMTTRYLDSFEYRPSRFDVISPGTQTTVQDYPGRAGYWHVGVPPSGPFDAYSFRLGNRLLNNDVQAAGLEITLKGPTLRFSTDTRIVLAGASLMASVEGEKVPMWQVHTVAAGDTLTCEQIDGCGMRSYLCVQGGIVCPQYLGSRATFTLGKFGGHAGRALRAGDVLHLSAVQQEPPSLPTLPEALLPVIGDAWELRVVYGPHGAPDFFTDRDIETFFESHWEVHYNSSRTGVRLIGPTPEWARSDGGEAGLHPSNIHDNAYAFGTVDFTGDMPVILGPDGPSLGGFVCPATVITADLWKLGQLKAGDTVRFTPVSMATATALEAAQLESLATLQPRSVGWQPVSPSSAVLSELPSSEFGVDVRLRPAGDHFLLVEYGEQALDIRLRFRAHALMQWLQANPLEGLRELTPGIRSLQLHFDSQQLSLEQLTAHVRAGELQLAGQLDELKVPSRTVYLPLSWDDVACQQAVDKYTQSVRPDAPWCPDNLEFIRRINGLADIAAVREIVFSAAYLVMGLGDVYLGAPVATPVDPRHRLVTTKYNPARTWTAENSVGIGGSYLCVYGMEGPGGYQFIGRTLQMWNRYRRTEVFDQPWLLRFFDQIRFFPVSEEELQDIRRDFPRGLYPLRIEEGEFSLADYEAVLRSEATETEVFRRQREQAFADELADWHARGQFDFEVLDPEPQESEDDWPDDSIVVDSPVSGSVWRTAVEEGQQVRTGDTLMILESMKMEIPLQATCDGTVRQLRLAAGARVSAGQALVVLDQAP
ncbi:MAG: urea carboxylase [Pseudomonadota bacterium]